MEDDKNLPNANRFQRAAYRLLTRTANSSWFTKFAANTTPEKMRERRERRTKDTLRLMLPMFGILFIVAACVDFRSPVSHRMVAAAIGFAILWLSRGLWQGD